VNAEEAARLAEESSDDGVLPSGSADDALEPCSVLLVGATFASNVEASSDIDVSLAGWGGAGVSAELCLDGEGGMGVGAGEHD